jgi:hypothetical protein
MIPGVQPAPHSARAHRMLRNLMGIPSKKVMAEESYLLIITRNIISSKVYKVFIGNRNVKLDKD